MKKKYLAPILEKIVVELEDSLANSSIVGKITLENSNPEQGYIQETWRSNDDTPLTESFNWN